MIADRVADRFEGKQKVIDRLSKVLEVLEEVGDKGQARYVSSFIGQAKSPYPSKWGDAVLSPSQWDTVERAEKKYSKYLDPRELQRLRDSKAEAASQKEFYASLYERVTALSQAAHQAGDDWARDFAIAMGKWINSGKALTEKQKETIEETCRKYHL